MTAPVGFIGLGVMGGAMARRLLAAGHEVVVHNRTVARAEALAAHGARVATSPAEVAAAADPVFACLLDGPAVEDVWLGPEGIVAAARPGQVLVEHGTFAPALAREVAAAAAARGAAFLDVPVTGGPEGARAGTLVAMAGGDPVALDRLRPLLAAYACDVVHAGASGAGLELKLVNQLLVGCHVAAAAEAAALLRALRIEPAAALRVLTAGWAASAMLERCLPRALRGDHAGDGAPIGGMVEIQRLVAALAADAGAPLRLVPTVRALFEDAVAAGLGDHDLSGLVAAIAPDQESLSP